MAGRVLHVGKTRINVRLRVWREWSVQEHAIV